MSPVPESAELFPEKAENVPTYVIPTVAVAEWRNPPRSRKHQRMVKSAT